MGEPLTILIAARDEETRIGTTVARAATALSRRRGDRRRRRRLPRRTAARGGGGGAHVVRLPRRGKGQALTLAEREAPQGELLLCDADSAATCGRCSKRRRRDDRCVRPQAGRRLRDRKRTAAALIEALSRLPGREEPLSGSAASRSRARRLLPVAAGLGVETWLTIDAVGAKLSIREPAARAGAPRDRATCAASSTGAASCATCCSQSARGRQHRGLRLPLVGWVRRPRAAAGSCPLTRSASPTTSGAGRSAASASTFAPGTTTGVLKLVGIPVFALLRTRSLSGALLVGLAANPLNQLDTRPGRALKGSRSARSSCAGPPWSGLAAAVLLAPYDLREMAMLGDSGSNTLGAVLGFRSVEFSRRGGAGARSRRSRASPRRRATSLGA